MKLSWNWLKDYTPLPNISAEQVIKEISLSICEVEQYQEIAQDLEKILVAQILEIKKHPHADRLSLVKITTKKEQYEVVCGAKNFAVGDKVPYAPLGTNLEGFEVKKAKIRGIESHGVLCAEDEIGFSDDHEGLMLLPKEHPVGTSLLEIYPDQKDLILDIDNKSINHRPDLWGHYGFARELSVLFHTSFQELPFMEEQKFQALQNVSCDAELFLKNIPNNQKQKTINISVDCPELVPRFSALEVENLQTTLSPDWMRFRLYRIGLRAINNLVDVTNYVMLDLGQPMHIFDKDALQGKKLIVRKAQEGEKLTTLYEKEITLDKQDIVITDAQNLVSLAGVVGGLNSGVGDQTTNAVLEAACWHPSTIRKTSTKVKHRTDASQRYEKSLDAHLTTFAISKATHLLQKTSPNLQRYGGFVDLKHETKKPIYIEFDPSKCFPVLGLEIPTKEISNTLEKLGFKITKKQKLWQVAVPSWRATRDISLPEDLIEEVGRFFGYEKIISQAPLFPTLAPTPNIHRKLERKAKQILVSRGFFEIFTYPLTNQQKEKNWQTNLENSIPLLNPSSDEETKMRSSILPSMVEAISENWKNYSSFSLFELGRIYFWEKEQPQENNILMLASYSEQKNLNDAFQETKATASILVEKLLGRQLEVQKKINKNYEHPYASGDLFIVKKKIGRIFTITPQRKKELGWKGNFIFVELMFDELFAFAAKTKTFQEISKFPTAKFEISLVVPKNTYFADLKAVIAREKMITDIRFQYDYFLPDNSEKKSITLSMVFCDSEATIQATDLVKIQDKIVQMFEDQGFMLRR